MPFHLTTLKCLFQASEIDEEGGMGTGGEEDLEDLDEEEDGDEIEGEEDVSTSPVKLVP